MNKKELILDLEQIIDNKKRIIEILESKNTSKKSKKYLTEINEYYYYKQMLQDIKEETK